MSFSSLYQQGSTLSPLYQSPETYGPIPNTATAGPYTITSGGLGGGPGGGAYTYEYYINNYSCGASIFFPGGSWTDFYRASWGAILPECVRVYIKVLTPVGSITPCPSIG
jgi:hypothetical protein